MLPRTLKAIAETCPGAVAVAVMTFDGTVIATYAARELSVQAMKEISAEFSGVVTQIKNAAAILKVGPLQEVSIHSETLVVSLRVLTETRFVALAMRPERAYFGKGRFLLRMLEPGSIEPLS